MFNIEQEKKYLDEISGVYKNDISQVFKFAIDSYIEVYKP